jgi:hypothetical protein
MEIQTRPAIKEALYAFGLHALINYFKLSATTQTAAFAAIAWSRSPDRSGEADLNYGFANAIKVYLDVYLLVRGYQLITQVKFTKDLKSMVLGGASVAWAVGRLWDIKESKDRSADKSALTKWLVSWGETDQGKDAKNQVKKAYNTHVSPTFGKLKEFFTPSKEGASKK